MALNAGQVLQKRYRILASLGQGGMGTVYRAGDVRLSAAVALKETLFQSEADPHLPPQLHQQLQQEAQVLAC